MVPMPGAQGGSPWAVLAGGGLLLSGGIDSPVAGYLMSKRGLKLDAIYFHAYPYTSDDAKGKVVELARRMAPYNGGLNLFVVPFTDIQLEIKKRGPLKETTLLTRAAMVETAGRITRDRGGSCLVTGEALSQVASQTVQSMAFTESTADLPILRPLIGFDKEEVIAIARRIETFETSILPYEDCCALFSPKHPVIKPDKGVLRASYEGLRLREGLEEAIENTEKIYIAPGDGILPPRLTSLCPKIGHWSLCVQG